MYQPHVIKLYTILHIRSLYHSFEVIMNMNRVYYNYYYTTPSQNEDTSLFRKLKNLPKLFFMI